MTTLTVPSRVESVRPATAFLVRAAREFDRTVATEPVFEVAISEAVANAVTHGSGDAADATITCQVAVEDGDLTVRIIDDGGDFDVRRRALPDLSADEFEAIPESGYGLPIIQSVFASVRVISVDGRFGLEMRRALGASV